MNRIAELFESPQEERICPDCRQTLLNCRCGGGECCPEIDVQWMLLRDLGRYCEMDSTAKEQLEAMLEDGTTLGLVARTHLRTQVAGAIYVFCPRGLILRRFAVHPDWRRRGVGQRLMAELRSRVIRTRRDWITMLVPEAAVDLQCFLRASGFVHDQTVSCPGNRPDMYVFRWERDQPHGVRFRPAHRLRHLV